MGTQRGYYDAHIRRIRPTVTEYGRRNFATVVEYAGGDPTDVMSNRIMANALAGLIAEITPTHRDALMARMVKEIGAAGRMGYWRLPPGLSLDEPARRKWAALALLDCIAYVSDAHSALYDVEERNLWRERALLYTQGAEHLPVDLRTAAFLPTDALAAGRRHTLASAEPGRRREWLPWRSIVKRMIRGHRVPLEHGTVLCGAPTPLLLPAHAPTTAAPSAAFGSTT